jgi:hypothetical protein
MSKANKMECGNTQTCDCCGGSLPARDIWEANRDHADDCTGSVDSNGRCRAFSRDELWQVESDEAEITAAQVEQVQGETEDGAKFGYVHGEGGGFFFTWRDTLEATLASVEEDEMDGAGELSQEGVVEFLREYLPTTKRGQKMWGEE